MFGQANKGFAGFGASNTTFGGFGQSSTGFGSGSAFGTQTPSSGSSLFGAGNTSSGTTGGLFGQATSSFGQSQNTGFTFGGAQTSNTAGSSLFGASSQPGSSGGSLFATPSSGSGFGAKPGGFAGFGTSTNPAGSGGLFGSSTGTTPSLFGQTGGTSAFGAGAGATAAGGTTVTFNPPSGTDTMMKDRIATNINTRHQCITAMKEYEAKSLEELRIEDYSSNRKSKQAGGGTTGGLFGQGSSTQTSTGGSGFVFGGGLGSGALQTSTTGFGGFGGTSSAATTPFNQNRPLFGTATTTQSGFGFGTATGTQQSNSLFGNTARPLFGSTASTQQPLIGGGSFFGGSAAGAANPVGFGSGASGGGLFGAAKPTGFGAATTSSIGFGGGSSLFGKTSTASTFGFGTNTSTAGGFGGTSGGSLFNMKPSGFGTGSTGLGTGGSSFGFGTGLGQAGANTAAKPSFGGFSFGGGAAGSTTGFGSTLGGGTGTGTLNLGGAGNTLGLANAISQSNSSQHLLALASSPYGDNPLFWNLKQQSKDRRDDALKPTNPTAQKAALVSANQYKVSPRPTTKIKPKSLHNLVSGGKTQLFEGLEDEDFSFGDDTFVPRKSVKKLVLRKGFGNKSSADSSSVYSDSGANPCQHAELDQSSNNQEVLSITRPLISSQHDNTIENEAEALGQHSHSTPLSRHFESSQNKSLDDSFTVMNQRTGLDNQETPQNRLTAADTTTSDLDNSVLPVDRSTPHPTGVTLTRPGYYTIPALDDMVELMDENGNCYVEDLTVGRENYGNVFFPGITNVAGMNLDDIVHFRRNEVTIYPDDEKKPPLGDGLNKKAEVTLDCVWPKDKSNRTPIKSPERLKLMNYAEKIETMTARLGAKFIDYRPETGSWVFQVNHFSKYGLLDDSDEEGAVPMDPLQFSEQQAKDILLVQKLKTQQEQLLAYQKEISQAGQGQIFTDNFGLGDTQTSLKRGEQAMMQEEDDFAVVGEENEDLDKLGMQDLTETEVKKYMQTGLDDKDMDGSMDSKFLASSMGVSAQNIQGMKASFFGDNLEAIARKKEKQMVQEDMDDYEDDMRSLWKKSVERSKPSLQGLFKYPTSLSLPQSPAFSDHSEKEGYEPSVFGKSGVFDARTQRESQSVRPSPQTFMQPPIMEHKLLPSGLQPSDLPQRINGTQIYRGPVHFKESLIHNKQKTFVDAACFMGRSFRVGWGPTWTLAHSGRLMGLQEEEPQNMFVLPYVSGRVKTPGRMKGWFSHIEQVQITDYMHPKDVPSCKQLEEFLEVQLQHARVSMEKSCPKFVPAFGVDALHQLADRVKARLTDMKSHPDSQVQSHMDSVLGLCVALWGNLSQADDLEKDDSYRERQLRREAVSKWLTETSASKVAEEMETCSLNNPEAYLRAVFSQLTVRDVSSACVLAQRAGDFRLALLLAQSIGGPITRHMLAMQLESWAEQGAIDFISELRQKIYCLLAGQLVWHAKEIPVNTCEGLDWKRAFAMHLWYKSAANSSIQHSLKQYQHGFQGTSHSKPYCVLPLPPYLEEENEERSENEHIYDTAYHLLCLYVDRTHRLEALLSPTSSTPAHLDFRLSWQLFQILQALGYTHLPVSKADSLHESFASQLETLGMWHWTAFVLLHLSSGSQRHAALSALLQRHLGVGEELTEREEFLLNKLHVPAAWLHQAKAVRAHREGNHAAEARHLILAGQFNRSHTVVVRHVAADAIINDNDDYLKSFLDELALPDRCVSILNWNSNGKVFLDFIYLRRRLEQLKKSEPSTRDMEELEPCVMSLCGRVKGLTCLNSKDRLCQAEMAKTSASLLRTFLALREESPFRPLTTLIPELPMSEDYTLQELQALSRARLMEIV
ncbi:hypothetical protein RRG08_023041 [Elysia crispata]|uniref:Nuclear pore complex protein Nup98-Nup96 n=1 Tax=Elysia crispata TaxID=231223 RepID=A0AAE1AUE7_9GAST|nr:hypothetical protein RRG08_023041 [Elysia crispata]